MKIRVFGFDFFLEYSFLLMLSFAIIFGAEDIGYLLLFSSLHEIGHIAALMLVGGKVSRLTLSFYGLALKYDTKLSNIREIIVILFGPLVNLILYIILKDDINLILFALNILPIYPLDGGRIIKILLPDASRIISIVSLIIVTVFSVYLIIVYHSFSMILISVYLLAYSILF